jgi:hypothetical protein
MTTVKWITHAVHAPLSLALQAIENTGDILVAEGGIEPPTYGL